MRAAGCYVMAAVHAIDVARFLSRTAQRSTGRCRSKHQERQGDTSEAPAVKSLPGRLMLLLQRPLTLKPLAALPEPALSVITFDISDAPTTFSCCGSVPRARRTPLRACKVFPDYASSSAMVTIPSACKSAIQVRHACSLRASATRASDLERGYGRRMVPLQKSQHTDFKQLFDVRNWLRMVRNQEVFK